MSVIVSERDEQHLSHEAIAMGRRIWDVVQNGELVGIFHSEAEALSYRAQLEREEQTRHDSSQTA
jgi:hypothetical protein